MFSFLSSAEKADAADAPEPAAAGAASHWMKRAQAAATGMADKASELSKAALDAEVMQKVKGAMDVDVGSIQTRLVSGMQSMQIVDPVDVDDLHWTHITKRIVAMGFPAEVPRPGSTQNHIDAVAGVLSEAHAGHFRIWNISGTCRHARNKCDTQSR